jgi:hypothetical protein
MYQLTILVRMRKSKNKLFVAKPPPQNHVHNNAKLPEDAY